MFFETIAKFDTFQFICGTPREGARGVTTNYIMQCIFALKTKVSKSNMMQWLKWCPKEKLRAI